MVKSYPKVLTIAGSDSGGGAGIQADLKTISSLGVYGMSAITAITAQNTIGVTAIQAVDPAVLRAQIDAVMSDIGCDVFKIGMLHAPEVVNVVADAIDRYKPGYVVLDPVMISTSGHKLIEDETIELIRSKLFAKATVVTPNIDEAILLSGIEIKTLDQIHVAASVLLNQGCKAVLMKGGHLRGNLMVDTLFTKEKSPYALSAECIDTKNDHGTGCTLSSAIASYLALGEDLASAVRLSKQYITNALRAGAEVETGKGHGPLNHFFAPLPLKAFEK